MKLIKNATLVTVVVLFLCINCGGLKTKIVNGHEYRSDFLDEIPTILKRASFELNCDESKLSWQSLVKGTWPKSIGVRGCGLRAVYLYLEDQFLHGKWVLNSNSKSTSSE